MISKYIKNVLPIISYIISLLFMLKFSVVVNSVFRVIIFSPFVFFYFFELSKNVKSIRTLFWDVNKYILILFVFFYILFGYNRAKFDESLGNVIFIIENIVIIYGMLSNIEIKNAIRYHQLAISFVVIVFVFLPSYAIVGNLQLGAFYNLIDDRLLTSTTVEGPLLASIMLLYCFFEIFINKNYTILNIVLTSFAVFLLLLFNRRGFIFSSIFSILFYAFFQRTRFYKLIYLVFIFLFLPMFWEIISYGVIYVSDSELFSSIIVRNDKEELLTATGRVLGWNNILTLFSSFDSKFIFGYYGMPPETLFMSGEEGGRYAHAHNTFLQLFIDGGYLLSFLFAYLFINSFEKYIEVKKRYGNRSNNFYFLVIVFLFFLSSTESLIRGIQFSNFMYIYSIIGFNIINVRMLQGK